MWEKVEKCRTCDVKDETVDPEWHCDNCIVTRLMVEYPHGFQSAVVFFVKLRNRIVRLGYRPDEEIMGALAWVWLEAIDEVLRAQEMPVLEIGKLFGVNHA